MLRKYSISKANSWIFINFRIAKLMYEWHCFFKEISWDVCNSYRKRPAINMCITLFGRPDQVRVTQSLLLKLYRPSQEGRLSAFLQLLQCGKSIRGRSRYLDLQARPSLLRVGYSRTGTAAYQPRRTRKPSCPKGRSSTNSTSSSNGLFTRSATTRKRFRSSSLHGNLPV